jgi:hypothetical protein
MTETTFGVFAYRDGWRVINNGEARLYGDRTDALEAAQQLARSAIRHGETAKILAQEPAGSRLETIPVRA